MQLAYNYFFFVRFSYVTYQILYVDIYTFANILLVYNQYFVMINYNFEYFSRKDRNNNLKKSVFKSYT